MSGMVFAAAGVLVLGLVLAAMSHRVIRRARGTDSAAYGALSHTIDVFDPDQARAQRDLDDRRNVSETVPAPDGHDAPHGIDPTSMRATISLRRP